MSDEIHVHVPKGATVIVHEDEPTEPEPELTLEEKIDELLRLAKEAVDEQMIQLVPMPYPVYPTWWSYPPAPPPITWTTISSTGTITQPNTSMTYNHMLTS